MLDRGLAFCMWAYGCCAVGVFDSFPTWLAEVRPRPPVCSRNRNRRCVFFAAAWPRLASKPVLLDAVTASVCSPPGACKSFRRGQSSCTFCTRASPDIPSDDALVRHSLCISSLPLVVSSCNSLRYVRSGRTCGRPSRCLDESSPGLGAFPRTLSMVHLPTCPMLPGSLSHPLLPLRPPMAPRGEV